MMSTDFDYSVKFPTVPFTKPTSIDLPDDSNVHKRYVRNTEASDSDDEREMNEAIEECNDKEPVVLLLGWLGCKEAHLSKYENIYYENGCVVIQYIPNPDDIFFNHVRIREHAGKLLELLEEMTLAENPIFIHLFSNAGAIVYVNMLEQLRANKALNDTIHISGVVWDSSPGKMRLLSSKNAYLAQMPNASGILRTVVGAVFMIVFFFLGLFGSLMALFDRKRNPNFYRRLKSNVLVCPHLFLYSKCDNVIYHKDVEEMIAEFKRKGCSVSTLSWEDSKHVQHFREHPESYAKQSIHFLQSCVSH